MILGGLFKKVVVSSYLAAHRDPRSHPRRSARLDALFAILGYAIVIYADFSGYTDIAIGTAKLLGFRFPKNFDRPYAAASIQDFWRRWHMTLPRWPGLPLHPARREPEGRRRTYINVMVTMILGGLWHGAAWTFVLWGAYHGALLAGHHAAASRGAVPEEETRLVFVRRRAATFALVCVGWVLFRSDSVATAVTMLSRLVTGWFTPSELVTPSSSSPSPACSRPVLAPELGLWLQAGLPRMRPAALGVVLGWRSS